jgi:hypothetical protein
VALSDGWGQQERASSGATMYYTIHSLLISQVEKNKYKKFSTIEGTTLVARPAVIARWCCWLAECGVWVRVWGVTWKHGISQPKVIL